MIDTGCDRKPCGRGTPHRRSIGSAGRSERNLSILNLRTIARVLRVHLAELFAEAPRGVGEAYLAMSPADHSPPAGDEGPGPGPHPDPRPHPARAKPARWTGGRVEVRVGQASTSSSPRSMEGIAMETQRPAVNYPARRTGSACVCALLLSVGIAARAGEGRPTGAPAAMGRELFTREWVPDDPRSFGGDGLGPAYNESSCVACHNLGGPGGGGPTHRNVDLLTATPLRGGPRGDAGGLMPEAIHPGFRDARSIVLHRFGTDPGYASWRQGLLEKDDPPVDRPSAEDEIQAIRRRAGASAARQNRLIAPGRAVSDPRDGVILSLSQRNPPALFGVGLMEAIPESAIRAAADLKNPDWPLVHGRVSRLPGGRLGRFGWKAQVPSLRDFVLSACASELGLEVPDHHQARLPAASGAPAKGLDLSAAQCDALVAFVAGLRGPAPDGTVAAPGVEAGRALFAGAGCANCHAPSLGPVEGIYSDLLLHDMGPDLADRGSYYGPVEAEAAGGANGREWRTPPLWGLRDSAPYLHDGRAATLEEAVALHGGEGGLSARRFFELPPRKRLLIQAFLRSLAVPPAGDP